jgi:hypothetical protein
MLTVGSVVADASQRANIAVGDIAIEAFTCILIFKVRSSAPCTR